MTGSWERIPVALSAEARMHQRARQEAAPASAAVVVDTEISARLRGGIEWDRPDAVAVAVLARPVALDYRNADVAWAAAGLAAVGALGELTGDRYVCDWPDGVRCGATAAPGAGETTGVVDVAVTASTHLGPGRVDYAVLVVRAAPVGLLGPRDGLIESLVRHGRDAARLLDDPAELLDGYRACCATLGHRVAVSLVPNGATRGVATDIAADGGLVVRSATGLAETVAVTALRTLSLLDA